MHKRLLMTETVLMLCLPMCELSAKGEQHYLPKPNPKVFASPKTYQKTCQAAEIRHKEAVQRAEERKEVQRMRVI